MASTNDLKNGMVLNLDGQLWSVVWFQHHKPGKGGAVMRTKLKNVLSGKVVDKTFNADVKVEVANVDKRDMTYLYNDGGSYVFMDKLHLRAGAASPPRWSATPRTSCWRTRTPSSRCTRSSRCTSSSRPRSSSPVEYTEPGLQGDRSTGGTKPAKLETGYTINVPLFLTTGEKVKVDTRTGDYLGRVTS